MTGLGPRGFDLRLSGEMATNLKERFPQGDYDRWICPRIGDCWKLARVRGDDRVVLRSLDDSLQFRFSAAEGFALQHFTDRLTVSQVQSKCRDRFGDAISANLVVELLEKSIALGILELPVPETAEPEIEVKSVRLSWEDCAEWICPDLTPYWTIAEVRDSDQIVFKAKEGSLRALFSSAEGLALRYFIGYHTVREIQAKCEQELGDRTPANLLVELLQKLIQLGILAWTPEQEEEPLQEPLQETDMTSPEVNAASEENPEDELAGSGSNSPGLKSCVHWIEHPDGYWILRNPEDVTFLQTGDRDKRIIDQVGNQPPEAIAQQFSVSPAYVKRLLQMLAATAMLEGSKPPERPKKKFNPMQLLFFRIPLFNPNEWLNKHIDSLRWIWTRSFAFLLGAFLISSAIVGTNRWEAVLYQGQQMLAAHGGSLLIPFALLSALVVGLHELGHAFTLKNYGGIVPEIGLLFIMMMPAAYTNTTDSYCLVKRLQRFLVVAAGVLVQFTIWAIAFWLWNWATPASWLQTSSYMLMVSALVTVAVNLNPLAKFDGYYLAVALSGINNLRGRSFGFYGNLFRGKPTQEKGRDALVLAIYAPFSLVYIWFVFGFLVWRIADWSLTNIPATSLMLLIIWLIYFYFPSDKS